MGWYGRQSLDTVGKGWDQGTTGQDRTNKAGYGKHEAAQGRARQPGTAYFTFVLPFPDREDTTKKNVVLSYQIFFCSICALPCARNNNAISDPAEPEVTTVPRQGRG